MTEMTSKRRSGNRPSQDRTDKRETISVYIYVTRVCVFMFHANVLSGLTHDLFFLLRDQETGIFPGRNENFGYCMKSLYPQAPEN